MWADSIRASPSNEEVAAAAEWLSAFAAGWPAVADKRAERTEEVLQEIKSHVVE